MLLWAPGPIVEDGIWAQYWYIDVHKSKGFGSVQTVEQKLSASLTPLYEQAMPYYEKLKLLFNQSGRKSCFEL